MAKAPSLTLQCKQCNYVNEPERVYCHNCGTKLDRSVLPKESEVRRESPEKAQRRIKKMTNPGASPVKQGVVTFAKTVIFATLAAGLIQMLREPADAPQKSNELSVLLSSELAQLVSSPQPRTLVLTEGGLNATLKQAAKAGPGSIVTFDRAYVNLTPGKARFGMQQSVWGFPLHSGIGFKPEFQNGVFTPVLVSGNIGRLPVHPELMPYVSYAFPPFRKLQTGMKREREYLQQLRDIRVEQGRVILVSRGATGAAPAKPALFTVPAAPAAPAAAQ